MSTSSVDSLPTPEGVFIEGPRALDSATGWLALDSIRTWIEIEPSHHEASSGVRLRLTPEAFARWTPGYNTLMLADQLEQLFAVSPDSWLAECDLTAEYYAKFGEHLPAELGTELEALRGRLASA